MKKNRGEGRMVQKEYDQNKKLDFQTTDKFAVLGVSGRGKTTLMEECALTLKEKGKPFIFVATKGDYRMHNHKDFKKRLSQANLDFNDKVVSNSTPEAMFFELDVNASSEQTHFDIETIKKSINSGSFLFFDESENLLWNIPELNQLFDELIESDDCGFAISRQQSREHWLKDTHGMLKKVDFWIEASFQPKQK